MTVCTITSVSTQFTSACVCWHAGKTQPTYIRQKKSKMGTLDKFLRHNICAFILRVNEEININAFSLVRTWHSGTCHPLMADISITETAKSRKKGFFFTCFQWKRKTENHVFLTKCFFFQLFSNMRRKWVGKMVLTLAAFASFFNVPEHFRGKFRKFNLENEPCQTRPCFS